jgi:hypothetical protein
MSNEIHSAALLDLRLQIGVDGIMKRNPNIKPSARDDLIMIAKEAFRLIPDGSDITCDSALSLETIIKSQRTKRPHLFLDQARQDQIDTTGFSPDDKIRFANEMKRAKESRI